METKPRHKWIETHQPHDTGNGAICYVETCSECGARRKCIEYYAVGRGPDVPWHIIRGSKHAAPCARYPLEPGKE